MANGGDDRRARFERLYDLHRARVLAYCLRRTTSGDADDACAETFLVAWRRIDDVPDDDATLPYLFGIAARVLANQDRASRRRRRLVSKSRRAEVSEPNDPVTLVIRRDQDRSIENEVRRLPAKYRDVVMLYTWDDLTRSQIALTLGISKAAVDQRIHRAYRRLARSLRADRGDAVVSNPVCVLEEGEAR